MNTTIKGDIFEERVYRLIKELLDNDEYYLNRKNSEIFKKKGYYSEKRKADIIFDITIESYIGNSDTYSHLNIIECKNLNKNVTVDDIEEFDSKIRQIGEHDTKGTLVSSKGFAKSTINLAKSLKIALLNIKSDNHYEWINYRIEKSQNIDFENNQNQEFIGLISGKTVDNMADYLLYSHIIDTYRHKEKYIRLKYIQEEELEGIVKRLYKYDIHENSKLSVSKICKFLSERYSVDFDFSLSEPNVLGKIEFYPLKIYIQNNLEENRFRFTLCHEIGHLILHSKLLVGIDKTEDNDSTLSLKYNATEQFKRRLEYQANIFASHLLLPSEPFKEEAGKFFIRENIRRKLYFDNQPANMGLVLGLLSSLSERFGASQEAVKIKLISMNLLLDHSDFSFKKLLRDNTE